MREKFFFDEIWSAIRVVEEVSCSPLHPFEFTHILLLIFIALVLEHSNFYSRHFIEDRKSLESSYVFFSEMVPPWDFWCFCLAFLMFVKPSQKHADAAVKHLTAHSRVIHPLSCIFRFHHPRFFLVTILSISWSWFLIVSLCDRSIYLMRWLFFAKLRTLPSVGRSG